MNKKELLKTAKPILFNTEMVRAIRDGRKTQTRRVIKNIRKDNLYEDYLENFIRVHSKYKVGDILYVRETWTYGEVAGDYDGISGKDEFWLEQTSSQEDNENIFYRADVEDAKKEGIDFSEAFWKPSIHMPKKYARTFLKVTSVKVERLQDISIFDAIKEGVSEINVSKRLHQMEEDSQMTLEKERFEELWNSTSKDGYKLEDNPFVFVYEFEVLKWDKKDFRRVSV